MALAHAWRIALQPRDKLVLLALADHANDEDFSCFPSLRHLAEKTNMSVSSVQRAIKNLEAQGVIRRENRKINGVVQISNLYTMTYAAEIASTTPRSG